MQHDRQEQVVRFTPEEQALMALPDVMQDGAFAEQRTFINATLQQKSAQLARYEQWAMDGVLHGDDAEDYARIGEQYLALTRLAMGVGIIATRVQRREVAALEILFGSSSDNEERPPEDTK